MMRKLSRTVEYAVQATLQLAQSKTGSPVPCSQLATCSAMPERFLLQILRSLVTHGILTSTRGVVGGYMLARRPEDISLLDLIEARAQEHIPLAPPETQVSISDGVDVIDGGVVSTVTASPVDAPLVKPSSISLADFSPR